MKIRVTAKNYPQEVLRSETPVLVEFFAVWCGKCAMMEDVLDEIAKEYDGRVKVCQIEIEESAVLAAEFEVGIVPAFVVFRDGKPVNYANGVLAKDVLIRMLEICKTAFGWREIPFNPEAVVYNDEKIKKITKK